MLLQALDHVLGVNPLVTPQFFCKTHWDRCEETLGVKQDPDWAPISGCQMRCPLGTHPQTCLPAPTPVLGMATPGILVPWTWQNSQKQAGQATSNRPQVCPVPEGALILGLGVSRCCAIRQLLTSFQELFSSIAQVIFPTFFSTKRFSSLPGTIFSFPTKHDPKISLWELLIESKLLILLSAPRSTTPLFS